MFFHKEWYFAGSDTRIFHRGREGKGLNFILNKEFLHKKCVFFAGADTRFFSQRRWGAKYFFAGGGWGLLFKIRQPTMSTLLRVYIKV